MENREIEVEGWVHNRLATLKPPVGWHPDSGKAYARVVEVDRLMRRRHRKRLVTVALGAAACLAVMLVEAPKAYCAGVGCANQPAKRLPAAVRTQTALLPAAAAPAAAKPEPMPSPPAPARAALATSFKEIGAAGAPITCEIYSDYECPHCAVAFREVIPLLMSGYVQSGKVRLIHRDLPLLQHPHARLAARFANAAGLVGAYDVVVAQLFRTQTTWSSTGDIDAQVAEVLPPDTMQKVRELVNGDARLEDIVIADIAMARQDQIRATPSIVVVKDGHREVLSPLPSYELLRSYLDGLLAPR
jgi:protein-disulfide isomerase